MHYLPRHAICALQGLKVLAFCCVVLLTLQLRGCGFIRLQTAKKQETHHTDRCMLYCMGIQVGKNVISELAASPAESHPMGRPCQRMMLRLSFSSQQTKIQAVQVQGDTVPVRCFM